MKIHDFPFSPNCRKVRAVVYELGLEVEFLPVSLFRGASRTPEFLAINPNGRVPVLVDGDFVLWESNAIVSYLAHGTPLLPPPAIGALHEQTWETFATNWGVDTKGTFVWLRQALRQPMKRGGHIVVVSSGAAVQGSPVSGGYASAKRAQWFMADYAATESERAGLGLKVHCLLLALNPNTELGRAGIAAYAKRAGVTPEEFAKRFHPPLTPEIMGAGVAELLEGPERFAQLVYRIGGGGLAALS
jgi:glutathione S-transferase